MKTNVIYKENSSQEAKFRPYFSRVPTNCNLYAYGANNPVHYIDPTGCWIDNEDGTFTAEAGDTLWGLQEKTGKDWQSFGYEGDPTKLQVGDKVGKLNEWHVTGKGAGVGGYAAFVPFLSNVSEIDKSWYSMEFTIEETSDVYTQKFSSTNLSGEGLKAGVGLYVVDIQAEGLFLGKKPTKDDIIRAFSGPSEMTSFSFLWFGISGSENGNFTVNTGTIGVSYGLPVSYGVEKSVTRIR